MALKLNMSQALRESLQNGNVPSEVILQENAPLAILNRYLLVKARSEMAEAEMHQRNRVTNDASEKLGYAQGRLAELIRSHERMGQKPPQDQIDLIEKEITFHRDRISNAPPQKILPQPMEDVNWFVHVFKGPWVEASIPDVDDFDADEATLLQASAEVEDEYNAQAKTELIGRPSDEVKGHIIAELERMARVGEPKITSLVYPIDVNQRTGKFEPARGGHGIEWPQKFARVGEDYQVQDALALQVWLHKEEIQTRLLATLATRKGDGISADEKISACDGTSRKDCRRASI